MMQGGWILEGFFSESGGLQRVPLQSFPTRIGRQPDLELSLATGNISRVHAEISLQGDKIFLRDLGSTNGTYLNSERIEQIVEIKQGDVIHFASVECRLLQKGTSLSQTSSGLTTVSFALPSQLKALDELFKEKHVDPHYQAIVSAGDDELYAWEILGRGIHPDLPGSPYELFQLASAVNREVELSRLLRDEGIAKAGKHGETGSFFINTHPAEMDDPDHILESLANLKKAVPDLRFVLEIHEEAVGDVGKIKHLSNSLKEMQMAMAYDDFGSGQARLLELVEVPPEYLKFDICFIRGIDQAGPERRHMLESFIAIAKSLGIKTLAEGTETEGEVKVCRDIGFDLFQGYFFDKPTSNFSISEK